MKKTALILAVFAIFAVLTIGCSPRTVNIQAASQNNSPDKEAVPTAVVLKKETSQDSNFKIERKDSVLIPGLRGSMKLGDYMNMKMGDSALLERWRFDYALSERGLENNKVLTLILKATNISEKLYLSGDILLAEVVFYNQSGQEIFQDKADVMLSGKIDLERGRVESVKLGETLIIEPFFWVPASRLETAASYIVNIDARTGPRQPEYLPRGAWPWESKNGIYKEKDSVKGAITVEYKTDPSGKIAKISLTAMGNVLAGAQLRFNWLDKEGKVVLSEDKQDILQAISQYDRRYLFVNDRPISYIFDISFPQSEDQRIKYYEFWIEKK